MGRSLNGALTVGGGFLIQFILGTLYLWGNINVYVRSYFCYTGNYGNVPDEYSCQDCTLSNPTVNIVFPLVFSSLNVMIPFGVPLGNKIGYRNYCLIAALVLPGGIFFSSFMTDFTLFALLYGILFGLAGGLTYMIPFTLSHKFFPNNKGICSGIISSGFGLGSLTFSLFMYQIINPDNQDFVNSCAPKSVAENLPQALRWASLCYCICMTIGAFLLQVPNKLDLLEIKQIEELTKKQTLEQQKIQQQGNKKQKVDLGECPSVKIGLKQPILYLGLLHVITLAGLGIMLASNYKPYGLQFEEIKSDNFLTWAGNIGQIINSLSRFFWGMMMDYLPFKVIAILMGSIQLIVAGLISLTTGSKFLYILVVMFSFFAYGGLYPVFPTLSSNLFGRKVGLVIVGVMFQGFGLASWIEFFIVEYFVDGPDEASQYNQVFHYYMISPLIGILLAFVLKYKINWNIKYPSLSLEKKELLETI